MTVRAGARLDATDFILPDVVTAFGNGSNTITATSFAVLPTVTCSASITNPHPTASMLVLVTFGAWMNTSNGVAVRCCPAVSGSTTIAAGIGGGGPIGWGEVPVAGTTVLQQGQGTYTVSLPASANAAVFTMQAYRDSASGTQLLNYPTIRLVPLRFVF